MINPKPSSAAEQAAHQSVDDLVWLALCDPTRRKILDLLRTEPRITNNLCEHFDTTRFAIMKHLKVLEAAGLVISERNGRTKINHLNPVPIQNIYRRWIKPFEKIPADRMLRLKLLIEEENSHD